MNPMLEAAARAIYEAEYKHYSIPADWGAANRRTQHLLRTLATAALRAMREVPVTDEMCDAWCASPFHLSKMRDNCEASWRALLGAVIAEGGE